MIGLIGVFVDSSGDVCFNQFVEICARRSMFSFTLSTFEQGFKQEIRRVAGGKGWGGSEYQNILKGSAMPINSTSGSSSGGMMNSSACVGAGAEEWL